MAEEFHYYDNATAHKKRAVALSQLAKACKGLRQLRINLAICDRLLLESPETLKIEEDDIKETHLFVDRQEINLKEEVLHMQPRLQYQLLSDDSLTSTINDLWRLNSATRQDIYESLSPTIVKKMTDYNSVSLDACKDACNSAELQASKDASLQASKDAELQAFNLLQYQENIKISEYESLVHAMIIANM